MRCLFFFCRPIRGISPGESSRRLASLGSHSPLGDRRAACAARHSPGEERANIRRRRNSRTSSIRAKRTTPFAYPARRSESDSRSEAFSRRRARIFSPKARFPYFYQRSILYTPLRKALVDHRQMLIPSPYPPYPTYRQACGDLFPYPHNTWQKTIRYPHWLGLRARSPHTFSIVQYILRPQTAYAPKD